MFLSTASVVLMFWSQDPYFLKITEDSQKLLFLWFISTNICYIKNFNWESIKGKEHRSTYSVSRQRKSIITHNVASGKLHCTPVRGWEWKRHIMSSYYYENIFDLADPWKRFWDSKGFTNYTVPLNHIILGFNWQFQLKINQRFVWTFMQWRKESYISNFW